MEQDVAGSSPAVGSRKCLSINDLRACRWTDRDGQDGRCYSGAIRPNVSFQGGGRGQGSRSGASGSSSTWWPWLPCRVNAAPTLGHAPSAVFSGAHRTDPESRSCPVWPSSGDHLRAVSRRSTFSDRNTVMPLEPDRSRCRRPRRPGHRPRAGRQQSDGPSRRSRCRIAHG